MNKKRAYITAGIMGTIISVVAIGAAFGVASKVVVGLTLLLMIGALSLGVYAILSIIDDFR